MSISPLPRTTGWMGEPSRGAQLGRHTTDPDTVPPVPFRFYLQRVRLDAGGYDSGGAYWGIGAPLYRFEAGSACPGPRAGGPDDLKEWPSGFLRARTRADAKRQLRETYPAARFYA